MKKFNKSSIVTLCLVVLGAMMPSAVFAVSPATVNLGASGNFAILAKTGISTTGSTAVVGDIGLSPAAASYITGFSLTLPSASAFSTSAYVTGKAYAPGYADPTPANLTTAVLDMQTAYTDASGRPADVTELGAGNIGGLTLVPGVYKWSTGVTIPTDVTLSGGANDVWIFQVAQNLDVSSGVKVVLAGGASSSNIFWVVAGQTTLGTTSTFHGNILDQTTIVLNTGATLTGRALAQAAVTLDASNVTVPTSATSTPAPTSTSTSTPSSTTTSTSTTTTTTTTTPTPTPTTTSEDSQKIALQAQLSVLLAKVQLLQAQQGSSVSASVFGQQVRTIAMDLMTGSRDNNVNILQQFLISQNKGPSAQALGKNGATMYFGPLTRAALAEFQATVGIKPALGYFGPITRAYIMANY